MEQRLKWISLITFKNVTPIENIENIRCWSLKDVGILKLMALGGRVHKKDFYGLDCITDKIPLIKLMEGLEKKTHPIPLS